MATTNRAFRVKNGLTVEGAELRPAQGTTTYPPIVFTSGTNLTSAAAGAFEYDGTRFYLSPSTTRKAIALTDATGVTLESTITGSSLTSVGTLSAGTWNATAIGAVYGGTGQSGASPFTQWGVTYASTASAFAQTAAGTNGWLLQANTTSAPTWVNPSTLAVSSATTATKSTNIVGGNNTTLLGSLPYQSNTDTTTLLSPNTTTTNKFLTQTGNGTNGAAPVWNTIAWTDVSSLSGTTSTTFAAGNHAHGNITNTGAIGSTTGLVVVTGASGAVTVAATPSSTSTQFLRGDLTWVVPTDTYPTTFTYTAGTTAGPTGSLTGSGMSAVSFAAIPSAGTGASGIVTTGAQNLDGVKTFSSIPMVSATAGGNGNGTPTQALELVNKQYVDNIASGINAHDAVIAATTAALTATYSNGTSGVGATLTNSGTMAALVIDNVSLLSGDRVLVKNQSTLFQNGIYSVTTVGTVSTNWVLTRTSDYDQSTPGEVIAGDTTFVVAPAAQYSVTPTNQNTGWTMNYPGTITIGTSSITFAQASGSGTVTAGTGISVSGNQVSVDSTVLTTTSTQTGISNKTFTAPVLGAATATTINKVTITAPATGSTLTIAEGKTLTASNTLTFTGTDSSTLNIGTGGTLGTGAFATIANYVPTSSTVWGQSLSGTTTGNLTSVGTITGTNGTTLAISLPSVSSGNGTGITITGAVTSASTGSPNGGSVAIAGGAQTNATPTGTGGFVTITGGAGGTAGTGGSITINAGAGGAGGNGNITIGSTNTDAVGIGSAGKVTTISGTTAVTNVIVNAIANTIATSGSTTGTTALALNTLYSSATYNGAEFIVKATNSTNIEITKILVVTDGTNVYVTNYGDVYVGASGIVTVDFTYTSGNVNMIVTPVSGTTGTTTVKVTGTLLAV